MVWGQQASLEGGVGSVRLVSGTGCGSDTVCALGGWGVGGFGMGRVDWTTVGIGWDVWIG